MDLHKVGRADIGEEGVRANDAGVGEEDIEPAVPLERVVNDFLDGLLVGGIELARVDVYLGVQAVDLALVRLEVGGIEVADVDGLGPVLCELVGRGTADAQNGVCAWEVWCKSRECPRDGLTGAIGAIGANTSDDDHLARNPRSAGSDLGERWDGAAGELVADGLDTALGGFGHCSAECRLSQVFKWDFMRCMRQSEIEGKFTVRDE